MNGKQIQKQSNKLCWISEQKQLARHSNSNSNSKIENYEWNDGKLLRITTQIEFDVRVKRLHYLANEQIN